MRGSINAIKCSRCGLYFNIKEITCYHCADVPSVKVANLRDTHLNRMLSLNDSLAFKFKIAFVIILIVFSIIGLWPYL